VFNQNMSEQNLRHPAYVNGIYIPCALLVFGIFIIKREWVSYAVAAALGLGGWKFLSMRMCFPGLALSSIEFVTTTRLT
jgi:hypothetical protein